MGLLGSETREGILMLMLLENFKGSIREIAKKVKIMPSHVRKELKNLEEIGILKKERISNALVYSVNEKCTFIDELRALLLKLKGAHILIKKQLSKISGIESAFIFGSYATGRMDEHSDIDLFIVGKPDMKKLNCLIFEAEKKINRKISFFVYSKEEFRSKKNSPFIKNILSSKKISLVGDFDELIRT
ncbi:MAG: nucleotidyltransferase domain-containing protein [Candidatus Anstonellales archaeon]